MRRLEHVAAGARGSLVASLLVLPATGLGALAHFTLVAHEVCVEHGALAHAKDHAHRGDVENTADSVNETRSAPAAHGHDHCFVASFTRIGSVVPPVGSAVAASAGGCSPFVRAATAAAPVALLRLAPKSSPPALSWYRPTYV